MNKHLKIDFLQNCFFFICQHLKYMSIHEDGVHYIYIRKIYQYITKMFNNAVFLSPVKALGLNFYGSLTQHQNNIKYSCSVSFSQHIKCSIYNILDFIYRQTQQCTNPPTHISTCITECIGDSILLHVSVHRTIFSQCIIVSPIHWVMHIDMWVSGLVHCCVWR
jgi:hypothetical protein